jgi:hypothetical protein
MKAEGSFYFAPRGKICPRVYIKLVKLTPRLTLRSSKE